MPPVGCLERVDVESVGGSPTPCTQHIHVMVYTCTCTCTSIQIHKQSVHSAMLFTNTLVHIVSYTNVRIFTMIKCTCKVFLAVLVSVNDCMNGCVYHPTIANYASGDPD